MDYNRGLGISGILHATVDIHFRVFLGWTQTFCVCVWNLTIYSMDYPLTPTKVHHWTFFYMHANAIYYWMAGLGQSWTSMVGVCPRLYSNFSDGCPWLKVLTNVHTHTHTRTHTHTHTLLISMHDACRTGHLFILAVLPHHLGDPDDVSRGLESLEVSCGHHFLHVSHVKRRPLQLLRLRYQLLYLLLQIKRDTWKGVIRLYRWTGFTGITGIFFSTEYSVLKKAYRTQRLSVISVIPAKYRLLFSVIPVIPAKYRLLFSVIPVHRL